MSSIWTPGGESPVSRDPEPAGVGGEPEELTEEEMQARLGQLRDQLANAPVEGVVAQFAYQLFEVGALHLSLQPPQLEKAALAIDAMGALVEGLGPRLGEHEDPLRDGLSQIRMAFVQIRNEGSGEPPPSDPGEGSAQS